jgi:hypothetical protein
MTRSLFSFTKKHSLKYALGNGTQGQRQEANCYAKFENLSSSTRTQQNDHGEKWASKEAHGPKQNAIK